MKRNLMLSLILLPLIALHISENNDYNYKYLNYDEIISKINELSRLYPNNMKVFNQHSDNVLLPETKPCGDKK